MTTPLRSLVFSILIILTACTPPSHDMDSGLFTGKPCKAPCWNGLTPGVSTATDVEQFVQSLNTKDWPGRKTRPYGTGCELIQIADQIGTTVHAIINMQVDGGKLAYIQSIHGHMPSLQQVVDHLGSPEYYQALDVLGPDGQAYMLTVYYPKRGVVFEVSVHLKDLGYVRPEMVVSSIEYFEQGELLSYFLARYSCNVGPEGATLNAQVDIAKIRPWTGFGKIQVVQTR